MAIRNKSAYQRVLPFPSSIGQAYADSMKPVVTRQFALARLRLAAVLHTVLNNEENLRQNKPQRLPAKRLCRWIAFRFVPGKQVVGGGKAVRVRHLTAFTNKPICINTGAAYPNSPLTLILWQNIRDNVSYEPGELTGKSICVTGTVSLY